jgi:hypothetical protein
MQAQVKSSLMSRLLLLAGAAFLLIPITAQAAQAGADLSVTKTCANNGQMTGGLQPVLCTVTIINIGTIASVAALSFTDTVTGAPPGTDYIGAGSGSGLLFSCSPGQTIFTGSLTMPCTANAESLLPNGAEQHNAMFAFKVPAGAPFQNCVTVSQAQNAATLPDLNLANNTACTTINPPPPTGGGGPITVITPPPTGACASSVVVSGIHYPNQSCAQTTPGFVAGVMSSFHFTSKCAAPNTLLGVTNVSCQNAPISGFPNGSVYQGTACCGTVAPPGGKITIAKKIINNAGIATPGPFEVQVKCNPNVPYSSVSLTGPGFQHAISLPAGGNCKIEEVPPKAPPGCTWLTTYPNGQAGKVGDTLAQPSQLDPDFA